MGGALDHTLTMLLRSLQAAVLRLGSRRQALARAASTRPVGIFVDLDNVAPERHGREDAKAFAQPLKDFAKGAGTLNRFVAFGNHATRAHAGDEERARRKTMLKEQEHRSNGQTGYDEEEVLRCGVCGYRAQVKTKKHKAAGMTPERLLRKHMKLHDSQQQKRRGWQKAGIKLSPKLQLQLERYRTAQVGLRNVNSGRNDLFKVLREEGVACKGADDVDVALVQAAHEWMASLPPAPPGGDACSEEEQVQVQEQEQEQVPRGCLIVVSQDADFAPLLSAARKRNVVAISAAVGRTSLPAQRQTRALEAASDLVIVQEYADGDDEIDLFERRGREFMGEYQTSAQTDAGRRLLRELESPLKPTAAERAAAEAAEVMLLVNAAASASAKAATQAADLVSAERADKERAAAAKAAAAVLEGAERCESPSACGAVMKALEAAGPMRVGPLYDAIQAAQPGLLPSKMFLKRELLGMARENKLVKVRVDDSQSKAWATTTHASRMRM